MIVNFLQALLAFILVLAPLVFIHELGHFLAAKAFRIGVPVFSIGFGPRIFGFKRAETDYRLSLVPLGGYVRLAGDESDENRTGAPEEFLSRPKYQRFIVFVAGATFNVILAFLAMWLYFGVYGAPDTSYPVVRYVAAESHAEQAGVRVGDLVIEIDGKDLVKDDPENVVTRDIILAPNKERTVLLERDGEAITTTVFTGEDPKFKLGSPGWSLEFGEGLPTIGTVVAGSAAQDAGLLPGDEISGLSGIEGMSEAELKAIIEKATGTAIDLTILREGREIAVTLTPRDVGGVGMIGVSFAPLPVPRRELTVSQAAAESLSRNIELSKTVFVMLKRLVTRDVSIRGLSGPVGIAQVARNALFQGPDQFLYLIAFFSLQLGVLNLLPIPVLDGGHILILFVEGLIRRDLPETIKERVMQAGFVFLLAFMGLIVVLDIIKSV